MTDEEAQAIRDQSMATVTNHGLHPAEWLPLPNKRTPKLLRPAEEIARRLMGLHATVAWCCASENLVSSVHLNQYIDTNGLFDLLTDAERDIVNTERESAAEFRDQVGWYTENMWGLAWVLGFEMAPGSNGTPMTSQVGPPLNRDFLELFDGTVDGVVNKCGIRPLNEVMALEDEFYCAHNAFRSLALEHDDAKYPCGIVHERRHALTWSLSPGVAWEHTDLST